MGMMKRQSLGKRCLCVLMFLLTLSPGRGEDGLAPQSTDWTKGLGWTIHIPASIKIKYLEIGSGDHELSFDWLLSGMKPASPPPQPELPKEHHNTPILNEKIDDLLHQKVPPGVTGNR